MQGTEDQIPKIKAETGTQETEGRILGTKAETGTDTKKTREETRTLRRAKAETETDGTLKQAGSLT